jgi:hypothetical protein
MVIEPRGSHFLRESIILAGKTSLGGRIFWREFGPRGSNMGGRISRLLRLWVNFHVAVWSGIRKERKASRASMHGGDE